MACCLMALSHYLNQCWQTISDNLCHPPKGNFTGKAEDICPWYEFENTWLDIAPVSPRGHWINKVCCNDSSSSLCSSVFIYAGECDRWADRELQAGPSGWGLYKPAGLAPHQTCMSLWGKKDGPVAQCPNSHHWGSPIEGTPLKTLKQSMAVSESWRVRLLLNVPTAIIGAAP